jgi:hypothetical protein
LRLNGGQHLARGWYRLLVCGSTSIVDLAGNPIDGDGDGSGGDDLVLDLGVTVDNLLANPNFDDDLAGWEVSSPTEIVHGSDDASLAPTSGSAAITNLTGMGHTLSLSQCVAVSGEQGYFLGGKVWVDSGLALDPEVHAQAEFYAAPSCGGSFLGSGVTPAGVGDTGIDWVPFSGWMTTPAGAVSAEVFFVLNAGASPDFEANLDDVFVFQMVFGDGYEWGDTSGWSHSVP